MSISDLAQRKELENKVKALRTDADAVKKAMQKIEVSGDSTRLDALLIEQTLFLPGLDALVSAVSKKFSASFQRMFTG